MVDYMVGQTPNYSAPLVNFFGKSGGQQGSQQNAQQQQGQQNPQAGNPGGGQSATNGTAAKPQTFAQYLQSLFASRPTTPQQTYQPNGPMNIDPNATVPGIGPGGPSGIY